MFLYNSVLTFYLTKMKLIYTLLFLLTFNSIFSQQKQINNYKYLVVPEKFGFLKKVDQYQTSSLTKFLFKKNGFTVLLDTDEFPLELKNNPCNALNIIVEDKSSMFKTIVFIELRDCLNKTVYTSKEGNSRIKEYKKSYQEAIRRAHASMVDIKYEPIIEVTKTNDNNNSIPATNTKSTVINNQDNLKSSNLKPLVKTNNINLEVKNNQKTDVDTKSSSNSALYAQAKENGFQLINLKPEVVFVILNSKVKNVFIIKGKNGIFYLKDNNWIAEYYKNGKLVQEKYQVKF